MRMGRSRAVAGAAARGNRRRWSRRRVVAVVGVALAAVATAAAFAREEADVKLGMESGTVTSKDGTRIAYSRIGRGPPVVLVDGAFCYRENGVARAIASALSREYTVYLYDRRGRGESGDSGPYRIEREVEDLEAVVAAAGGSPHLLGMSSGAMLALRAAARSPRIQKLALWEPPFVVRDGRRPAYPEIGSRLQELVASGERGRAVRLFMTDVFGAPRTFVLAMRFLMPRAWANNERVAHTLAYDVALLDDWSILEAQARSIRARTLVLGGAKSPAELRRAVDTVAEKVPGARARFLDGQSHMVKPQVLAGAVADFFGAGAAADGGALHAAAARP